MTKKEFMQTCKATIPDGYFEKVNPHYVLFMCDCENADGFYLAAYRNGRAGTCGCLPWACKTEHTNLSTGDQETFALNLKEVIPPTENK